MSAVKKEILEANIRSSMEALERAQMNLDGDFDASLFEVKDAQCRLDRTVQLLKEIKRLDRYSRSEYCMYN